MSILRIISYIYEINDAAGPRVPPPKATGELSASKKRGGEKALTLGTDIFANNHLHITEKILVICLPLLMYKPQGFATGSQQNIPSDSFGFLRVPSHAFFLGGGGSRPGSLPGSLLGSLTWAPSQAICSWS